MLNNTSLSELCSFSELEVTEDSASTRTVTNCAISPGEDQLIYQSSMSGGKKVNLLKTLLTSACERDCYYCPFRAGRDFKRETYKPEEMADAFMDLFNHGSAQGIFLSSGVSGGSIRTQDKLLDTAEILRNKHAYKGYLHLKIMPGAEKDQVLKAMQLANRISINLESPNNQRLGSLAPHKIFLEELLRPLQWANEVREMHPDPLSNKQDHWPSLTTQFVVGATHESDLELLSTTVYLYKSLHLSRVYYSAFKPVKDTPLENLPPENPIRQDRLYQASFLIRDYGFDLEDLQFSTSGNLPIEMDPKTVWAMTNLSNAPIEINSANRLQLLRVPGIGPDTAMKIMNYRNKQKIVNLDDLKKLGIRTTRMLPFILFNGKKPTRQLSLF